MASSSILRRRHFIRFFLTVALACDVVAATTGVTPGTLILKRGADANSLTSSLDVSIFGADYIAQEGIASDMCQFDGGIVNFLHPMSLKPSDRFFATGQLQLRSIEMMVDEINTSPRCGILVGGKNYGIQLTTVSIVMFIKIILLCSHMICSENTILQYILISYFFHSIYYYMCMFSLATTPPRIRLVPLCKTG